MTESLNRAVQLEHYGGPESLHVTAIPMPTVGPGQVRVRVLASSVNYTETLIRRHLYPQTAAYKTPFVMGTTSLVRSTKLVQASTSGRSAIALPT